MIDPSIALGFKPAPVDNPLTNYTNALQAQGIAQQNALSAVTLQEKQAALQQQNALRAYLPGKDLSDAATEKDFRARFPLEAPGVLDSLMKLDSTRATIGKTKADTAKTMQEVGAAAFDRHLRALQGVNGYDDAVTWSQGVQADTSIPPEMKNSDTASIPRDPVAFEKWKRDQQIAGMTLKDQLETKKPTIDWKNTGGALVPLQTNPYAGTVGPAPGIAPIPMTATPDAVLSSQTQRRGQNMTDARQREANAANRLANGKAPAGYVWGKPDADGNPTMIAVKGGPADLKQQGQLNQDTQALAGALSSMDRLGAAANEVLNAPGLAGVYGLRGVLPNAPGSDAANAAALLNTLKSQVGFGVLQEMRNNSKTGGALGSVSDKENQMLQENLAALEKSQSVEQAKANLRKIVAYSEGAKDRLRAAYNMKHGDGAQTPASRPPLSSFGGR